MAHTPHTLDQDFPEFVTTIDALKAADAHFVKLVADYEEINDKIHRWETNVEPMEDLAMVEARKQRGVLKDQIFAALRAAEPA